MSPSAILRPVPTDTVNWLERKEGGFIDFRLPGDPRIIPDEVLRERRHAYLEQCTAAMRKAGRSTSGRRFPASRWRDFLRSEAFEDGEDLRPDSEPDIKRTPRA